jgi:hypothetical protein
MSTFQNLYQAIPLSMGSGGSVGSAYLNGLTLAGIAAVGAFSTALLTLETSVGPVDGTYGTILRAAAPASVGTVYSLALTGTAGAAYRFDWPVGPVYWFRVTSVGTNQTADRTLLVYGRP